MEAALRLDTNGAEARALAEIIEKELSERSRRLQVQGLVDSARQGIAQRQFGNAIESLRQAERLDPADSNVRELLQWANRGQEQEQRRKDLLDLTDQIHGALRAEDFSSAYTISEVGLVSFPNEPTLQRLKSIAEKQRDVAERRRFVQDQSLAAKELLDRGEFSAAIKMLEAGLAKLPTEPNLEALLALARTESERQSQDQESLAAKEASERALMQAQATQRQAAALRKALDDRDGVDHLEDLASQLRQMLIGVDVDDQTRRSCLPALEEVRARQLAKEQVSAELQDLKKSVEDSFDPGSWARAKTRLLEVKAEFPHEVKIQEVCEEGAKTLDARGEEYERIVAELTKIAESVKQVQLSESTDLLRRATQISSDFPLEPQIGALIQQIEYEVNRRLGATASSYWGNRATAYRRVPSQVPRRAIATDESCPFSRFFGNGRPGSRCRTRPGESRDRGSPPTISRMLTEVGQITDQRAYGQEHRGGGAATLQTANSALRPTLSLTIFRK